MHGTLLVPVYLHVLYECRMAVYVHVHDHTFNPCRWIEVLTRAASSVTEGSLFTSSIGKQRVCELVSTSSSDIVLMCAKPILVVSKCSTVLTNPAPLPHTEASDDEL